MSVKKNVPAKKTVKKSKSKKSSSSGKVSLEVDKKHILYAIIILLVIVFALSLKNVEIPSSADDVGDTLPIDNIPEDTVQDTQTTVDDGDAGNTVKDTTPVDVAPPEPQDTADDNADAYVPEAGEIVASFDEAVQTDVLDIRFNSYETVSSYVYQTVENGTERTDNAIAGKQFFMLNFTVINKGALSVYVGYGKVTLLAGDIYIYDPIVYEGYDALPKYKKISPGTEMTGIVLFEIPSNSEDIRIRYSFSGLSITERFATWFL
ncbi:MAG: DUF4352 domain-containing protein [Candidatus Aenigmarchaeota archaeon]|nr:DUF4352 domain-containing protein [Candidatus Aenigmarchaeota archaeon]